MNLDEIQLKVMSYIDGELSESEALKIEKRIESEDEYKNIYLSLKKVKKVTQEMKLRKLPEMYWDDYWEHVYNRIERGISWILISIGVIIIGSFMMWQIIENVIRDQNIHVLLKAGIFLLLSGFLVLVVSILREKLMIRKVDKYREVER